MSDWKRLADHVLSARKKLGWSQVELARHARLKHTTVSSVENAAGTSRKGTLHAIGNALGWTPDSIEAILDGGEPRYTTARDDDPDVEARRLLERRAALVAAREAIEREIAELDGELHTRVS